MADISKIKTPNNTTYDIKDSTGRTNFNNIDIKFPNLLRLNPTTHNESSYLAYTIPTVLTLSTSKKYILQVWGATVTRNKTQSAIGIYVGGGSVKLGQIIPNEDGYGKTIFNFTNSTHANWNNAWLNFYNLTTAGGGAVTGTTYTMHVDKWKLTEGNIPTDWEAAYVDKAMVDQSKSQLYFNLL